MHEEVNDLHRRGDRQNHGRSVMGIERKGRKEEGFHFFLPSLSFDPPNFWDSYGDRGEDGIRPTGRNGGRGRFFRSYG